MTKAELEIYRQKLLALGKRLKGDVHDLESEAFRTTGGESSGNLSNTPVHMADLGTDMFEQEVSMSLLENQERMLEEIVAALARIQQGTFGNCEDCRKPIAKERLQALPYTRLCIACASKEAQEEPSDNL